jgi:hypothetical protein
VRGPFFCHLAAQLTIGNSNLEEQPEPHMSLRVMDFMKGSDHPLATTPNIRLQFGGKAMNINDAHDAHMRVAGDNIIVMITQARALPDYIFLVGFSRTFLFPLCYRDLTQNIRF